uniref:(northern house mosquito) hypothetical protein n=1 Tax=Culex pipiens TaxID=7175 RepID=A0A8D8AEY2_CULPI
MLGSPSAGPTTGPPASFSSRRGDPAAPSTPLPFRAYAVWYFCNRRRTSLRLSSSNCSLFARCATSAVSAAFSWTIRPQRRAKSNICEAASPKASSSVRSSGVTPDLSPGPWPFVLRSRTAFHFFLPPRGNPFLPLPHTN